MFAGKIDVSSTFPNYYKSLSRRLYKVLENIGASTYERDARIRVMTTSEIMHSMSKARFHVEVNTHISIRNTQILHCALR